MTPRLRQLSCWCMLLSVAAIVGCDGIESLRRDDVMKPVHRLVDRWADPGTADYPVASIGDDTRFVLAVPPRDLVFWPKKLVVPDDSRIGFRQLLRGGLKGASRVVVLPEVYYPGHSEFLQPLIADAKGKGARRTIEGEFELSPDLAGKTVRIHLNGYATDLVDLESIRTREVEVPESAVLEFAIGKLEAEVGYDPVEFAIQACDGDACAEIYSEVYDPAAGEGGWRDRRVPLAGLGGTSRSFVFEARATGREAPFSFPLWANPTVYVPRVRDDSDVNVILLSIDTLRADHLTSYGYRHDTAPFLERRFAREGTVFEHPVAAATLTTPSHMSIFTSLQPESHGTVNGLSARLPDRIPTLAELVRAAGIDTAAVTEDGWLGVQHGFGRGFDTYVENRSADIMAPEGQVDVTFSKARSWLERNRDKQFFLFLHTFQVHSPYAPPQRYAGLFGNGDSAGGDGGPHDPAKLIADYDREIRYTDDEIRLLFEALEALELDDKTIFVVTSDHGEAFLEHGAFEHGAQMYQEAVGVPLLMRGPGIPSGRRVEVPVAHVDLMPTVLDFFGISPPDFAEGTSLVELMADEDAAERFAARPLFSESPAPDMLGPGYRLEKVLPPAYGVRMGPRKLSRYKTEDGYRYELYDLESDPHETRDLFPEQGAQASDLVELIDGYQERSRQVRAQVGEPDDETETPEQPEGTLLDPEQEEKLRALGYLE